MTSFLTRNTFLLLLSLGVLSAADITGLWSGQAPDRRGEPEDIAFQFKVSGSVLAGKLFGDEFDLSLEEGSVVGDVVTFAVTTTNYYNGEKVRVIYSGLVSGNEIGFTRERVAPTSEKSAKDAKPDAKPHAKPKPFKLKRLTSSASAEAH